MPIFQLADDPNAQQRLGDSVGHLPAEVVGGKPQMPAWTSFVFALVSNPERAFLVTDPGEADSLRNFIAQSAPGSVVER